MFILAIASTMEAQMWLAIITFAISAAITSNAFAAGPCSGAPPNLKQQCCLKYPKSPACR